MERQEAVFISLRTQFENLGDCIINWLLISELAKSRQVYVLHRGSPDWLRERLQSLEGCHNFDSAYAWCRSLISAARSPSHCIVYHFKPGHYVSNNDLRGLTKSIALFGFTSVSKMAGWRFRRVGVSFSMPSGMARLADVYTGRQHDCYGLRDRKSLQMAKDLGIAAVYSPDLAFLLSSQEGSSENGCTKFGISFRRRDWIQPKGDLFKQFLDAVGNISQRCKLEPVAISQVAFDESLTKTLSQELRCCEICFEQSEDAVQNLFADYGECRFVISNRLHVLIFAWSQGAIPIPLADRNADHKVIDLFQSVGLGDLTLNTDAMQCLEEHVAAVVDSIDMWRDRIKSVYREQQAAIRQLIADTTQEPRIVLKPGEEPHI